MLSVLSSVSHETIVTFFVGLLSVLGILRIVMPECRRVIRELWSDFVAAADAIRLFRNRSRNAVHDRGGL